MRGELMSLQQFIESYVETIDADFGIYIKHLQTNEEASIQGDTLFQTASVIKLPILATLYEMADAGEIDLSDRVTLETGDRVPGSGVLQEMMIGLNPTIKDLAMVMIIVSDNLATDKLLGIIGGVERVQQTIDRLGFNNMSIKHTIWELLSISVGLDGPYSEEKFKEIIRRYTVQENAWDSDVYKHQKLSNDSSARDMAELVALFAKGEFISQQCSNEILDILHRQQYKQRIAGRLPRGTAVANKTGTLGTMFNDAGVVYLPNNLGQYVICVFSKGHALNYEGNEPIAQISKIAFDYFVSKGE